MKKAYFIAAMILVLGICLGCGNQKAGGAGGPAEGPLNLLFVSHTFVDAITPLIADFEAQTGIKVNVETLAEGPAFEKLLADLSSGTGTYDLFMTSPINNWQYVTGGWVEPLDAYIADKAKTAAGWDYDDFVPGLVNACRWTGTPMSGVGEGTLWALPINYESYMLSYRPSILKKYNLSVPTTYEELAGQITRLKNLGSLSNNSGQAIYPIVTRFDKYWDLTYLTFGTMLQTYGVELVDAGGNVAIDSPQSVRATELFIKMIQEGSPSGAGLFTWYEALQGFASGQYLYSFNEADGFASTYENPEQSQVSDDVGYALTPLGPDGRRSASMGVWAMSINSASKHKDAAWKFLQWATSGEILNKTHLAGNMNPVRKSAWDDPEVSAMVKGWGETEGQYLDVMKKMAEVAEPRLPAHPEITRILDIWAEAVQNAYFGQARVEDALKVSADEIRAILK
jgi:multiple sugar transport system substrate-binding protein